MIGDNELFVRRIYSYKDKVVNVLAVVVSETKGQKAVVYTNAINPEVYPLVVPVVEFCNHASLVNNLDEITSIRDISIKDLEEDLIEE